MGEVVEVALVYSNAVTALVISGLSVEAFTLISEFINDPPGTGQGRHFSYVDRAAAPRLVSLFRLGFLSRFPPYNYVLRRACPC